MLDPYGMEPDRASQVDKAGVVEIGPAVHDPVGLHLELDQRERAFFERDHLHRQLLPAECQHSSIIVTRETDARWTRRAGSVRGATPPLATRT